MMQKLGKRLLILMALCVVFAVPNVAHAEASPNLLPLDPRKVEDLMTSRLKKKFKEGSYYILGIEKKLTSSREELQLLKSNVTLLEGKIEDSKEYVEKLESQLQNIDRLIGKNEEKIRAGELQKARISNEMIGIEKDIASIQDHLKENFESLNKTVTAYYFQTNLFFNSFGGEPSLLAFLSSGESSGEILQQTEYLSFLQEAGEGLAKDILLTQEALDLKRENLGERQTKLEEIELLVNREKRTLEEAKQARTRLLSETKGKQAIYETLLELSKKEEAQVSFEIQRLRENFAFFEGKLDELKNKLPQDLDLRDNFGEMDTESVQVGDAVLSWPVSPALGLSALFHDGAYEKALGVRHNAIDIRITQGSKVKAAADGVISKVVDNGFGYSYIIIAHPDRILTLYGHMSELLVSEGEIVRQGQVIGLSGGIPGTKGAGWLTTGAHLHFEVFKNFEHVDPLEFLPLEFVPVSSLPDKYLKKLTGELEKVSRN